jgi:hypothetical protein
VIWRFDKIGQSVLPLNGKPQNLVIQRITSNSDCAIVKRTFAAVVICFAAVWQAWVNHQKSAAPYPIDRIAEIRPHWLLVWALFFVDAIF